MASSSAYEVALFDARHAIDRLEKLASQGKGMSHSLPFNPDERRGANYKLLKAAEKFEPCEYPSGTCGNITSITERFDHAVMGWYERVSAPYLLSRLCALFTDLKIDVHGQDGYKVTWQVALKHKATGTHLGFYDYKGTSSYASTMTSEKDAPKEFLKDVVDLLMVLENDACPHPYDGCVVGEIA